MTPTAPSSNTRPTSTMHRLVRRLKCLLWLHEWEIIDPTPGWWTRGCKHCDEYQAYELVDIGRSKTWVRYHRPPNTPSSPVAFSRFHVRRTGTTIQLWEAVNQPEEALRENLVFNSLVIEATPAKWTEMLRVIQEAINENSMPNETITAEDVKLLNEVLECWNGLSNIDKLEDGYGMMTDHRHDTLNAAEKLVEKLKRMADL